MTEPQSNAPETATVAPEAPQQPEQQDVNSLPQWARDAITKANREAAGYRTKVAELQPKAEQFTRLEEASKTELQRLQEAQAQTAREAEQAKADAARWQAAALHGIGAEYFDLLGTGTPEELQARAEKLAGLVKAQQAAAAAAAAPPAPGAPQSRPVEQLRPGATPGQAVDEEELLYQSLFGAPK
jgi:hypothetical protein